MPRYFFDYFEDGELFVDTERLELSGPADARMEAADIAAEIARDHLAGRGESSKVEVRARDAEGTLLGLRSVDIAVDGAELFDAPATSDIWLAPTPLTTPPGGGTPRRPKSHS